MEMQPGQMAYDRASTVFSPDGRLFQVEYALQAIQMGGTAVAVTYEGGIVFVAYRNLPVSSLAESGSIEKSFAIDSGLGCVTAGLIADSRVLVEFLRVEAQRHRLSYGEPAPYSVLGHALGTLLQQYTQFGGTRPFAVSLLLGGFNGRSRASSSSTRAAPRSAGRHTPSAGTAVRSPTSSRRSSPRRRPRRPRSDSPSRRWRRVLRRRSRPKRWTPRSSNRSPSSAGSTTAEVARRVQGLSFIGTPDKKSSSR